MKRHSSSNHSRRAISGRRTGAALIAASCSLILLIAPSLQKGEPLRWRTFTASLFILAATAAASALLQLKLAPNRRILYTLGVILLTLVIHALGIGLTNGLRYQENPLPYLLIGPAAMILFWPAFLIGAVSLFLLDTWAVRTEPKPEST